MWPSTPLTWKQVALIASSMTGPRAVTNASKLMFVCANIFGRATGFRFRDADDVLTNWAFIQTPVADVMTMQGIETEQHGKNILQGWSDGNNTLASMGMNWTAYNAFSRRGMDWVYSVRKPGKPFLVVGHSGGGMHARILAERMKQDGRDYPDLVITLGSPSHDLVIRESLYPDNHVIRVSNLNDGVTCLPTILSQFPATSIVFPQYNRENFGDWGFHPLGPVLERNNSVPLEENVFTPGSFSPADYVLWVKRLPGKITFNHSLAQYVERLNDLNGFLPKELPAEDLPFAQIQTRVPEGLRNLPLDPPDLSLPATYEALIGSQIVPKAAGNIIPLTFWSRDNPLQILEAWRSTVKVNSKIEANLLFKVVPAEDEEFWVSWMGHIIAETQFRSTALAIAKRGNRLIHFLGRTGYVDSPEFQAAVADYLGAAFTPGGGVEPPLVSA